MVAAPVPNLALIQPAPVESFLSLLHAHRGRSSACSRTAPWKERRMDRRAGAWPPSAVAIVPCSCSRADTALARRSVWGRIDAWTSEVIFGRGSSGDAGARADIPPSAPTPTAASDKNHLICLMLMMMCYLSGTKRPVSKSGLGRFRSPETPRDPDVPLSSRRLGKPRWLPMRGRGRRFRETRPP
jgi:hypothetical protein